MMCTFKLASVFTDHMVLQRNHPVRVFGITRFPGRMTVLIKQEEQIVRSTQQPVQTGEFCVFLEAMPAGGPYTLVVSFGAETVTLNDVLFGEVWIAGGQSNMEMPLFCVYDGLKHAKSLCNEYIRLYTVPRRTHTDAEISGWHFEYQIAKDTSWCTANEQALLHFSAIGAYFADVLVNRLNVPVGIISCNFGGTKIETWMSYQSQTGKVDLGSYTDKYEKALESLDWNKYLSDYTQWQKELHNAIKDISAIDILRQLGPDEFAKTIHFKAPKTKPEFGPYDCNRPGCLYENMLCRIAPYSVQGVIWYQGESNTNLSESSYYANEFSCMVQNWEDLFQKSLTFLTVELAPFLYTDWDGTEGDSWAYVREQQILAVKQNENVEMVTIGDAGDKYNIHPCNKITVGQRLALAAMKRCYGSNNEFSGPIYKGKRTVDGGIYIDFDHASSGLKIMGDSVADLKICGEDGIYMDAQGEIRDSELFIYADSVPHPINARMGFRNCPQINLYNKEGLIAAPFRTDGLL